MAHGRRCGAEDGRRGAPRPEHRCAGAQSSARVGLRARSGAPRRLRRCPLCLSPPSGPADRAATPRVIGAAGPCAQRSEWSLIGSWGGSGDTAHCGCRGAARPAGGRRDGTKRSPLHRGRAIPSVPRMGLQGRPVEVVKSYKPHRTVTKSGVPPFHYGCCHCVPSSHTVWIRCVEECDGTGITHTGQKHHAGFVSHSQPCPGLVTGPKEQGKDVPGQHVSKHLSWHQENLCHSTTLLQCK